MQRTLKEFLARTPFFGGLDEGSLDRLSAMLKRHTFREGATIFVEGDRGASMYLIQSGEILMVRSGREGQQVRLVRLRPGDFFGETTLIEMQPRPATAQAETDVVLLELTNMDLYRFYQADVRGYVMVLQNINRELCRRLRAADGRVTTLASVSDDRDVTQIAYVKPLR